MSHAAVHRARRLSQKPGELEPQVGLKLGIFLRLVECNARMCDRDGSSQSRLTVNLTRSSASAISVPSQCHGIEPLQSAISATPL